MFGCSVHCSVCDFINILYTSESDAYREQFGVRIALPKAIGAKDGSYLTPYVKGRNMIRKILQKKLEGVGVDVDYIITGRRKWEVSCSEQNQEVYDQCVEKILEIQQKLMELSTNMLYINNMISSIKKSVKWFVR